MNNLNYANNGFGGGFSNGGYYNNGFGMPVGAAPIPGNPVAVKKVEFTQPLSKEDFEALKTKCGKQFSIAINDEEDRHARCAHRYTDNNGNIQPALKQVSNDGTVRCSICGETFNLNPITEEQLSSSIATIRTALQQVKTYGLTLDMDIFTQYMMLLPLLTKLPQLYTIANRNFTEIMNGVKPVPTTPNPRGNDFDAISSLINGTYGTNFNGINPVATTQAGVFTQGYGMQPQQMYGTMNYQQPYMNNGMMNYQQPYMNNGAMNYQQPAPMQQQPNMQQPLTPTQAVQSVESQSAGNTQPFASNFKQPANAPIAKQQPAKK